jgi:hypothetical protein
MQLQAYMLKTTPVSSFPTTNPLHYRTAFAFSTFLYPLPYQRPLRFAFPLGGQRAYHVPLVYLRGVGPSSTPGALRLRQMTHHHLFLAPHLLVQAFWPCGPFSTFRLF